MLRNISSRANNLMAAAMYLSNLVRRRVASRAALDGSD